MLDNTLHGPTQRFVRFPLNTAKRRRRSRRGATMVESAIGLTMQVRQCQQVRSAALPSPTCATSTTPMVTASSTWIRVHLVAPAFSGVYVASVYDSTTGIESSAFNLQDRAVFALYFPPCQTNPRPPPDNSAVRASEAVAVMTYRSATTLFGGHVAVSMSTHPWQRLALSSRP